MHSGAASLHIRRRPARKADDPCACHRDQCCVEVPASPEPSHMQINQRRHDEGKARRRQPRAPVMHPKVLKDKHRAPVVERRLLQPRMPIEIRRNARAQPLLQRVGRVKSHQHLMRNLRIARFVRAHQAQPVASENRRIAIQDEEDRKDHEHRRFADRCPGRHTPA